MRHNVKGRKLGRTSEHRQALFSNQLASLIKSGRIKTTLPKAKELRPIAEKLVTKGKRNDVHSRRMVARWIGEGNVVKKLFDEVAPRFQERDGGYLRILKLGPRPGDGAEMAILEWVDYEVDGGDQKKAAKGDKAEKGDAAPKGKAAAGKGKAKAKKAADDEPEELREEEPEEPKKKPARAKKAAKE